MDTDRLNCLLCWGSSAEVVARALAVRGEWNLLLAVPEATDVAAAEHDLADLAGRQVARAQPVDFGDPKAVREAAGHFQSLLLQRRSDVGEPFLDAIYCAPTVTPEGQWQLVLEMLPYLAPNARLVFDGAGELFASELARHLTDGELRVSEHVQVWHRSPANPNLAISILTASTPPPFEPTERTEASMSVWDTAFTLRR